MASSDAPRSPLVDVWRQFIPQGHDTALRNAFYNVAAAVFVGGAIAAAWSVYLILQPFVQALMWAVLCGSVLHPVKYRISTSVRKWLLEVDKTKSLLSFSVVFLPITCLDNLSEFIGWYVMNHMKAVTAVTVLLPLFYLIIHHTPSVLTHLAFCILSFLYHLNKIIFEHHLQLQLLIVIIGIILYFVKVLFFLTPENVSFYRRLNLPVWLLLSASISCWCPSASVFLFLIFVVLIGGGSSETSSSNDILEILKICIGWHEDSNTLPQLQEIESKHSEEEEMNKTLDIIAKPPKIEEELDDKCVDNLSSLPEEQTTKKTVFVACVLVELWRHSYLLSLLPLTFGYYIIKKFTSYHIFGRGVIRQNISDAHKNMNCGFESWFELRKNVLFTPPVFGVMKMLKKTDRRIVKLLVGSVDSVVTVLIMLGCLLFLIVASIFLAVQIQGEGMQLIAMGSQVINATIVNNPQLHEMLPESFNEVIGSALDNGYLYGREFIKNMVRNMVGEANDEKAAALEQQVIELWDHIYQAWVVAHPQPPYKGPVVTSEAVAITFDTLVEGLLKTPAYFLEVCIQDLEGIGQDNLGTVMNVLDGVWTILISNLNLAVSALTTLFSLVLGGSLSILNAILNLVSIPFEESVNGVFKASFKMGLFYGMWTWLLHSIFATNIVYIPSVLGALFGAVPLVGTYWAAVPGALELAWGHESPFLGLLLIAAQLLPLSCVDTAFYAEIKGGGHPYLTGLAVAGGIFCWGVQGAILGPLLLCILLVVTKMYTSLIQSPTEFFTKYRRFRRRYVVAIGYYFALPMLTMVAHA
ncbi:Transmembrane protein [Armadillidium nasatum]|uniref:Transmembrane protein n=1 Tax=Armadillidium nasatum TaxID=96803 RepID=A0A5N5STI9_9CRUS|nr:Transmembrane protein [Armadillidium nasatum]